MPTHLALLVGAYHRPPARQLLTALPAGASLMLRPEPDNPYDAAAVQVWCQTDSLPAEGEARDNLEFELPGTGHSLDEVLEQPEWMLGYLAASEGKPLAQGRAKTGLQLQGNREVADALAQPDHRASLQWGPGGEPLVQIIVGSELS